MYVSKTKTKSGTTYYLIESYIDYKTKKKTTKIIEKIGSLVELQEKLGKGTDIDKWLKDYAKKKTKEKSKKDFVIKIKQSARNSRDSYSEKNVGYLYLKKLLNDLGVKKICNYISKEENLKFNFYDVFINIIFNKFLGTEDRTASTYKFSHLLLQSCNIKSSDVIEALKLIAKYNFYIQTEFYKNIRKNTKCDESLLFYDCVNYSIANGSVSKMLNIRQNNVYLSKTFFDNNGFPCFLYLEGNSFAGYDEEKYIKEFLRKYFKDASIHILPQSIRSDNDNEIFKYFREKYYITFQKISSFNDELKEWALDNKGWKTFGSNRTYNLEKIINTIESNESDYDEAANYAGRLFYKFKPITVSIPNTSGYVNQYFYLGFHYEYLMQQEYHRNYLINSLQKSMENKIHKAFLSSTIKDNNALKQLLDNSYITEGQTENALYFDDTKLRQDEKYDGFYSVCENFKPEDPKLIIMPVLFKLNLYDYVINRCKDERDKDSFITYDEYLLSHYITSSLVASLSNYISYKTNYKYPTAQVVDCLVNLNFSKVHKDGWMSLFKANELMDDLRELTGIDIDYQFISFKDMLKIIKTV